MEGIWGWGGSVLFRGMPNGCTDYTFTAMDVTLDSPCLLVR